MQLMKILLIPILIISCKNIPAYKKTFTVQPEINKVCRITFASPNSHTTQRKECYHLNSKLKDGSYKFNNFEGYILISKKALKETLLKSLDKLE